VVLAMPVATSARAAQLGATAPSSAFSPARALSTAPARLCANLMRLSFGALSGGPVHKSQSCRAAARVLLARAPTLEHL
jgi:hypothetical protein